MSTGVHHDSPEASPSDWEGDKDAGESPPRPSAFSATPPQQCHTLDPRVWRLCKTVATWPPHRWIPLLLTLLALLFAGSCVVLLLAAPSAQSSRINVSQDRGETPMIMEDAAMMEVPPNVGMEMGATMASAGPPDGMSFGGGSAKMARAGVTDNHYHGVGGRTADIPPVAAGEDRMIIMTGNIEFTVLDLGLVEEKIQNHLKTVGGFVGDSHFYDYGLPELHMTLSVPQLQFSAVMAWLKSLAFSVKSTSANAQDVSEEYVDVQARIKTMESAHEQLLELMKQAHTVDEILRVRRELRQVTEEMERQKARAHHLESRTSMSTIHAHIRLDPSARPPPPPSDESSWSLSRTLRQAFKLLQTLLLFFLTALIYSLVLMFPILSIMVLVVLGIRWLSARRQSPHMYST